MTTLRIKIPKDMDPRLAQARVRQALASPVEEADSRPMWKKVLLDGNALTPLLVTVGDYFNMQKFKTTLVKDVIRKFRLTGEERAKAKQAFLDLGNAFIKAAKEL